MTDSFKWIVSGASCLLLVGAFFAGRFYSTSGHPDLVTTPMVANGYPAPEVTIVAQADRSSAMKMLSRSSGLYGEGSSYTRRKKSKRTKPKEAPKVETASPKDADPEMGFMRADDEKLRKAMEDADRNDRAAEGGDIPHIEPNDR